MDRSTLISLVEAAVRAPSSHNTQPWLFRVQGQLIELFADRTRALPVNDPFDRELTVSCGAALFGLRVAAAERGLATTIERLPDPSAPDCLARVRVAEGELERDLARLRPAIGLRRTSRTAFLDDALDPELVPTLRAAATAEGAHLDLFEGEAREVAIALVGEGDRRLFDNPHWRRELASWLHPSRSHDGLATSGLQLPIAKFVVRHVDIGNQMSKQDEKLARDAPLLALLYTDGDEPIDWLRAGEALHRVLLEATARGVQAGYMNQPCQVAELRAHMTKAVGGQAAPQVMLRLGRPDGPLAASPRRAIDDVVTDVEAPRHESPETAPT